MNTTLKYTLLLPFTISYCIASMSLSLPTREEEESDIQFIEAAGEGSRDLMISLLRKGASITARDQAGFTALHRVAMYGHGNCLKDLIEAKGDVNFQDSEGSSALHYAALNGHKDCVDILIAAGANVNARNSIDCTALHQAALRGHLECVNILIKAKADLTIRNNLFGFTALHYAAENGKSATVKALIEAKADVNIYDSFNRTPLHHAARNGHVQCIHVLLEKKADINAPDTDGDTALHLAADFGHSDCIEALIKAKANINARSKKGHTALYCAAFGGHTTCVEELIKYSYLLLPSAEAISDSRKRIFNALLGFVRLRNQYATLNNLKDKTLQYEILSKNKLLQDDLVIILLDELKKEKETKSVALIRSKDAAVLYLLKKVEELISAIDISAIKPTMRNFLDPAKREENFGPLIRAGLDERCKQLKITTECKLCQVST